MPPAEGTPVDAIVASLSKYIGPNMARSSVHGQCAKLGLAPEKVRHDQLEPLVDALCLALNVFIGRDKAKDVHAELLAVVRAGGASR